MTDLKTLVEHEMERAGSPRYAIGDLLEMRDRKRRNKRIAAGVVAVDDLRDTGRPLRASRVRSQAVAGFDRHPILGIAARDA